MKGADMIRMSLRGSEATAYVVHFSFIHHGNKYLWTIHLSQADYTVLEALTKATEEFKTYIKENNYECEMD